MIPLRDTNPSETVPFINYALIAANIAAFLFETSLGKGLNDFIATFGLVPAQFSADLESRQIGLSTIIPIFTSMFLHAGWLHVAGNMLFLYIFGDNVEDRFGHGKYLGFYLLSGAAAALTQALVNPHSEVPMVGASGAIAGVLGAYVFMFPTAKVATLIPIFFFFQIVELPAYMFLGIWFLIQALSGLFALRIAADAGGVAWWAHIGGFAAGAILFPFLKKPRWR